MAGLPTSREPPSHPTLTYLRARSRDDQVPGSLDPGFTIHLHGCGLEKGDAEVGPLGNADA